MPLMLDSLQKAVTALDEILLCTNDVAFMNSLNRVAHNGIKAGVIQHFEFTYELCWKFIKRWLELNLGSTYVDGVTRRELFRLAAEHQLIQSVDEWMVFHGARNHTSHVYDPVVAEDVFLTAQKFIFAAKELLAAIEARND